MKPAMVLASVALMAASFGAGWMIGGQRQYAVGRDKGYAEGLAAAQTKLQTSGIIPPEQDIRSISGTVTAVGTDSLDMDAFPTVRNPLAEPAPTKRHVLVSASTVILLETLKPAEEFSKEQEAFNESLRSRSTEGPTNEPPAAMPLPPNPFTQKKITLDQIEPGMSIAVTADENIVRAATFTATEIRVTERATAPEPGATGAPSPERPTPPGPLP